MKENLQDAFARPYDGIAVCALWVLALTYIFGGLPAACYPSVPNRAGNHDCIILGLPMRGYRFVPCSNLPYPAYGVDTKCWAPVPCGPEGEGAKP